MSYFLLYNGNGAKVRITSLGASIVSWDIPVGSEFRNIVLGYPEHTGYSNDRFFMGAVVGPFANRIGQASFPTQNGSVTLVANEGRNLLHGGRLFDRAHWNVQRHSSSTLCLTRQWDTTESGYPTAICAKVVYSLSDDNSLTLEFEVVAGNELPIGPTGHAYFNLDPAHRSVEQHAIQVCGSQYTPLNKTGLPKGIESVVSTDFDYLDLKPIGTKGAALDDNFVLDSGRSFDGKIVSPDQKLQLTVHSEYPCMQVYTGKHLSSPFIKNQGICLEPQFGPDAPNVDFLNCHRGDDNPFYGQIIYRLEN